MSKFMEQHQAEFYAVMRIVIGFLFLWHGSMKLFGFPGGQSREGVGESARAWIDPLCRVQVALGQYKLAADDALIVGAEGHTWKINTVVCEGMHFSTGFNIPDLDRMVTTAGDEAFAVPAKAHTEDRPSMPSQRVDLAAGLGIPNQDVGVPNCGRDPGSIGAVF